MKKILSLSLLTASTVAFLACGKPSDDGNANGENPRARAEKDSPTPYPVADADRTKAVDELITLRKRMLALEGNLIAPAKEDEEKYADFLAAKNAGLARLFPNEPGNERRPLLVNRGGSYYQFKGRTNEYGYGSDIQYSTGDHPQFSVGFAGVDYGFFAQLGKTDIRQIDVSNPSVAFASSYPSMNGQPEPVWRTEQRKWSVTGAGSGGVVFKDRTDAIVGMSYVVRSVDEGSYDIVAVFQIVRRDPTDGSLIIAWKLLKELEKPILKRD